MSYGCSEVVAEGTGLGGAADSRGVHDVLCHHVVDGSGARELRAPPSRSRSNKEVRVSERADPAACARVRIVHFQPRHSVRSDRGRAVQGFIRALVVFVGDPGAHVFSDEEMATIRFETFKMIARYIIRDPAIAE